MDALEALGDDFSGTFNRRDLAAMDDGTPG
jgi:hypothetical protein